jgi:hypothetical protein
VTKYAARTLTVEAVQWTGHNNDDIINFAGPEKTYVTSPDGVLQVINGDCLWMEMHPGWWVTKTADGTISIYSCPAFDMFFRELGK